MDVTHHAGVVHFAVPFALCNFFAQIRQPNTGSITRNQILFLVCPAGPHQHTLLNEPEYKRQAKVTIYRGNDGPDLRGPWGGEKVGAALR